MSSSLHLLDIPIEVAQFQRDFVILTSATDTALTRLGAAIHARNFDFITEVIATEKEVLLKLADDFEEEQLDQLTTLQPASAQQPQVYTLPVWFNDQPDWTEIELVTGSTRAAIEARLVATPLTVGMFGFLPGFVYLEGLEPDLHVPRKAVPAKYVEAGSLAIGGKYVGVYALDSPGGWQVVGRVPISFLETPGLPPVRVRIGDQIHLKPIDQKEYEDLLQHPLTLMEYNARA